MRGIISISMCALVLNNMLWDNMKLMFWSRAGTPQKYSNWKAELWFLNLIQNNFHNNCNVKWACRHTKILQHKKSFVNNLQIFNLNLGPQKYQFQCYCLTQAIANRNQTSANIIILIYFLEPPEQYALKLAFTNKTLFIN